MITTNLKIALVVKNDNEASKKADELETWLTKKAVEVVRKQIVFPNQNGNNKTVDGAPKDIFCVFVLGGDGTFLSAIRWLGDHSIPILGVKFGTVGFLAEITEDKLFSAAESILERKFKTNPRMRLEVQVQKPDQQMIKETVLNDVVINKGALARLAHIETYINDQYLTTYSADGLIVATPTGSTAYSLAAGGPVVHPEVPGIIMAPICPFTLTNRPLVVPESVRIKIKLEKKTSDIMLTFDGQEGLEIDHNDEIIITKGRYPVEMISIPEQNYFDVLKAKLRWSGGRG